MGRFFREGGRQWTSGLLDPGLVERAGEFGLDQPLDDVRELLIEPALQRRAQQLSHEILKGTRLEPHRELLGAPPIALDRGELSEGGGRGIRNEPLARRMRRRWSRGTVPPSPTASVSVRLSAERGGVGAGALSGFSSSAMIRWIFWRISSIDGSGVTLASDMYLT